MDSSPIQNDGGVVLALLLMMAVIGAELVLALVLFTTKQTQLSKLISTWSNVGNAVVHIFLTVYLVSSDKELLKAAGVDDADNYAGPIMLFVINLAVGLRPLLLSTGPAVSFGWNTFVAVTGSLLPIVWPKFVSVGLTGWPYLVVVIWFAIFVFESLAFFSSCSWFALAAAEKKEKKSG